MAVADSAWDRPERTWSETRLHLRTLWLDLVVGAVIFSTAFGVYLLTLSPGLSYNSLDGAELATVPYVLGLAHSTGYPLYTWLGKLFTFLPAGDVAYRMNLMSATGAAVASVLLFAIVKLSLRLPYRDVVPRSTAIAAVVAGAFGALVFAFSRTLWSQAVITEVYTPSVAFVALTVLLLLVWARNEESRPDRRSADGRSTGLFGLFALVFGLSIGMHMSNLALAPAFVIFILLTNPRVLLQPQIILVGAIGFGLGVLQFAWLPIKAHDLNDPLLSRNTPSDLHGIYEYTLNAFPQMRWAYPLDRVPDRVVLYLHLLLDNFHLTGALLGVLGAWVMALRSPKLFFLFAAAYLAEMVFFLEYAVGDLDVFFIPAHFFFAVFIAFGAFAIVETLLRVATGLGGVEGLRSRPHSVWPRLALLGGLGAVALFTSAQPALSLDQYWSQNNQSMNTGIGDFYKLAFAELPQNSVLTGQSGVFGYDMFYWRLVYDIRPDISIPGAAPRTSSAAGPGGNFGAGRQGQTTTQTQAQTYSTTGRGGGFGPGGGFPGQRGGTSNGAWTVPIIAAPTVREDGGGSTRQLTLFKSTTTAPRLFVQGVTPEHSANASFGNLTLAGYDLNSESVKAGDTVHLKLYWRLGSNTNVRGSVSTQVGNVPYIETHAIGFGNVQQYIQANGQPATGSLLVEEYDLVILSSLDAGPQPLRVRVDNSGWADLGTITVAHE